MKKICYRVIGVIELVIGITTLVSSYLFQNGIFSGIAPKKDSMFFFIVVSAMFSMTLGIGMLKMKNLAKYLLIFFSGYIILTKALIYLGIIAFSGQIMTFIPRWALDFVSTAYHSMVILILLKIKE